MRPERRALFPRGPQTSFGPFGGVSFVLEEAIDWIAFEVQRSLQPFLGYFHLYPPHEPYHPRREFIGRFNDGCLPTKKPPHFFSQDMPDGYLDQKRREYDEHVAYADAEFGRLYDTLDQSGSLDNTYLVVTSDHGELFERGILGHITPVLYEPLLHVPLLISAPGQRQRQDVHVPTSCVDLLPTLLHLTGQVSPDWCEGEHLPIVDGETTHGSRDIFAVEAKGNPKQTALSAGTVALIRDRYKLIRYLGYAGYQDQFELYDLKADPEELQDLYPTRPSVAASLEQALQAKLQMGVPPQ